MGARRYRPGMANAHDPTRAMVWTEDERHAEVQHHRALADAGRMTMHPSDEVEAEMLAEEARP